MQARLLVDCEGPNPEFDPPDPRVDRAAWLLYGKTVPHTITVPAGTLLDDPFCYVHCVPDAAGRIRAEAVDDECRLMVAAELAGADALTRKRFERFWAGRGVHAAAAPPDA